MTHCGKDSLGPDVAWRGICPLCDASKPARTLLWLVWVKALLGWAIEKGSVRREGGVPPLENIIQSKYTSLLM